MCRAFGLTKDVPAMPPLWVTRVLLLLLAVVGAAIGTVLGEAVLWVLR